MIHMVRLSPSSIDPVAGKTPYRWEPYKQYLMPLNLDNLWNCRQSSLLTMHKSCKSNSKTASIVFIDAVCHTYKEGGV
ncbi:MAG: hypothetical protein LUG60_01465 [Erysipelotrichaceae bacterium]|nr:hypothetical protein [Erysipelotrichaceae bacterium]